MADQQPEPRKANAVNVTVRPLVERDLDEADRIMRLAFGTYFHLPDPMTLLGDAGMVRPRWRANPDAAFVSMLNGLAAQAPEACLIDPSKELRLAAVSLSTPDAIRTTTGHFSSAGNAALADALVRGLAGCGIKP